MTISAVNHPIRHQINIEKSNIENAIKEHKDDQKILIENQSLLKKISLAAFKVFAVLGTLTAIGGVVLAAITFSAAPIALTILGLSVAITCFFLKLFFQIQEPGEAIIVKCWKKLFTEIDLGNGKKVIECCLELERQEKLRPIHYKSCLGDFKKDETTAIIQNACVIGYFLQALEMISKTKDNTKNNTKDKEGSQNDEAIEKAKKARNDHLPNSSFPKDLKDSLSQLLTELIDKKEEFNEWYCKNQDPNKTGIDLLEHLIIQKFEPLLVPIAKSINPRADSHSNNFSLDTTFEQSGDNPLNQTVLQIA